MPAMVHINIDWSLINEVLTLIKHLLSCTKQAACQNYNAGRTIACLDVLGGRQVDKLQADGAMLDL